MPGNPHSQPLRSFMACKDHPARWVTFEILREMNYTWMQVLGAVSFEHRRIFKKFVTAKNYTQLNIRSILKQTNQRRHEDILGTSVDKDKNHSYIFTWSRPYARPVTQNRILCLLGLWSWSILYPQAANQTHDQRSQHTHHNPYYRSNKEAKNNKHIIRTTKHLIEDIHITTRIPLQQVRSYTNWDTTTRHSRWYNKVTKKHRPKEPQRTHTKIQYGEIKWEHPLLSSIIVNKTAFYNFIFYT
jgi:hypothetical protein